jgi:hypothetical protein
MLTYQVRPRVFRFATKGAPSFPADCVVRFHFLPLQPFGAEAGGGRTAVHAVEATALFNAHSGQHTISSTQPLKPLEVVFQYEDLRATWNGPVLTVARCCPSPDELSRLVEGVHFILPTLLGVSFADPPYVSQVEGEVGSQAFQWELARWSARFKTTTQEKQERLAAQAWESLALVATPGRRRLVAALHYFHVACRLARAGSTAGEFVAEVILNLTKVLEVLFPPGGDGRTRDAARAGLASLGFSQEEIEGRFLPAMVLRNEIDVGHVDLGVFTVDQLKVIHAYTDLAEEAFRDLLKRILERTARGEWEVSGYELGAPDAEATKIVERLRATLPAGVV